MLSIVRRSVLYRIDMPHHAITYHGNDKAVAGFDMEAMKMFGKESLSLLDFVVQEQGDTGSGDVPFLRRVFPLRHYYVRKIISG